MRSRGSALGAAAAVTTCALMAPAACSSFGEDASDTPSPDAAADGPATDAASDRPSSPSPDATPEVDAGAEASSDAEAGTIDAGAGCKGVLACDRLIFVTISAYTGNLGGLAGADAKCQAAAALGTPDVHTRTFKAWLSTSSISAQRLPHGTNPYRLTDGATVVASNWNVLTGGVLENAITRTETGSAIPVTTVWTGTVDDATSAALNCTNWTESTSAAKGTIGNTGSTGTFWTDAPAANCNLPAHLYCVED